MTEPNEPEERDEAEAGPEPEQESEPEAEPEPEQASTPEPSPAASAGSIPWFKLALPVVAFVVMVVWSMIPPYRAHIKNEKRDYMVWHWKLYQQGGAEVCDVRYFDMNQDGAPIERWKLLGFERPGLMPDKIGRVHHKQLRADHNRVCKALREAGDAQPNVEVWARCGLHGGWRQVVNRKHNVCGGGRSKNRKTQTSKTQTSKAKPRPKSTSKAHG